MGLPPMSTPSQAQRGDGDNADQQARQIAVLAQQYSHHIACIEEDLARHDEVEKAGMCCHRLLHLPNDGPTTTVKARVEEDQQHHYRRVMLVGIRRGLTAAQLVAHLQCRGYAHVISCRLKKNINPNASGAMHGGEAMLELIPLPGPLADAVNQAITIQRDAATGRKAALPQVPVDPSVAPSGSLGVIVKPLRSFINYVDKYALGEQGIPVIGAKATMQSAAFQVDACFMTTSVVVNMF